jgi:hypothetical protein
MATRLRVARGFGKTETLASIQVFATLQRRGHPEAPPPTVSDGWGGIREAMVEVYGQVPAYSGRGRPPTQKRPQPDWQYLQVVKQRQHGRVVYGDPQTVLQLFGQSTSYVERTHLTTRQFNGRHVRKTLGYSKSRVQHEAAAAWEDAVYNWCRPLKTLRLEVHDDPPRRWRPRTPAMAAGLTDHIWTVEDLLTIVPIPFCPFSNT